MPLPDFLPASAIGLEIPAATKDEAILALVGLLGLPARQAATLQRHLARRELLGSTGIGRGVAIPHCRTLAVPRLRMAYARLRQPIAWEAMDGQPVTHLFLLAAPPVEVASQYLPMLGRLAGFARDPGNLQRLARAATPTDVIRLLQG